MEVTHIEDADTTTRQFTWVASGDSIADMSRAAWCRYTGQSAEEIRNWGWLNAVYLDDREPLKQHWKQTLNMKRLNEFICRLRNSKGVYRVVRMTYIPVTYDNGQIAEWQGWIEILNEGLSEIMPLSTNGISMHVFTNPTSNLYQTIFQQASIGMLCATLDARVLDANAQALALLGYSREELIGQPLPDIVYPSESKDVIDFLNQTLMKELQTCTYEKRFLHKSGNAVWLKITTNFLQTTSYEAQVFLCQFENITDQCRNKEEQLTTRLTRQEIMHGKQVQVQQKTVELANQLKAIFSAITENVLVYDLTGNVLHANTAARKFLGWELEGAYPGHTYRQFIEQHNFRDEQGEPLSIDKFPSTRILHGEILAQGTSMNVIMRADDGHDVYLSITGAPVHNQHGQTIGGVCVFRDETEQRQKERRVQHTFNSLMVLAEALVRLPELVDKTTARQEAVAKITPQTVGQRVANLTRQVMNSDRVVFYILDEETDAWSVNGASGFTIEEKKALEDEMNHSQLSDYLSEEETNNLMADEVIVHSNKKRSGRPRVIFADTVLIAPMYIGSRLMGLFSSGRVGTDVSYTQEETDMVKVVARLSSLVLERVDILNDWADAHANELALQETNSRFDAFMSIASHELRTPLTTIKGNIQLAMRRLDTIKRQAEDLQTTLNKLERVKSPLEYAVHRVSVQDRMINDLLDASRIRADKFTMVVHPCNLVEILRNTVGDIRLAETERTIELCLPKQQEIPIEADEDRIRQVINNYLTNALKYSDKEQPVVVELTIEKGQACVAVTDKGPGLSIDDQHKVWERFYRVKDIEVQYGSGGGLGLGLYLCRMIIEMHHGQTGLSSTQGTGSTFWFTIPIQPALLANGQNYN